MVAIARITISDTATPTPYIDPATGEWMVYDATRGDYVSTGIRAKGQKGDGLEVDDSHFDEDLPPSWYQEHHPMSTVRESKSVGVLNVTRMGFQENCLLETITNYDVVTQHAILGDAEGVTLYRRDEPKSNFTRWTKWACPAEEVEKLEKGLASAKNTITALEQAKEEIEKGKLSASDLPAHLKWIYDAFNEGETTKQGGLTLTQIIGLANILGEVTAYISGRNAPGAHMLAAGVSSLADTDAVSYINYDGSAKFGKLEITDDGRVYVHDTRTNRGMWMGADGFDITQFIKDGGLLGSYTLANVGIDGPLNELFIRSGGGEIRFKRNGVEIPIYSDRLVPKILGMGYIDSDGSMLEQKTYDGSTMQSKRISEGEYRLYFSSKWEDRKLYFMGNAQYLYSENTQFYVSFERSFGFNYVNYRTADDSSRNDATVFFQIIEM